MVKVQPFGLSSIVSIDDAMPEQIEYGDTNTVFIEEWDHIELHEYGNIAIVKANYTLTVDTEIRYGIDVVTLFKDQEGWQIVSLVYEETKYVTTGIEEKDQK